MMDPRYIYVDGVCGYNENYLPALCRACTLVHIHGRVYI
jgi:hypothetical protein